MKKKKIKYSKEYKENTLRLCAERGNVSQVARELDLRPSMVYRWQKEQAQYGSRSFPGKGHEKLTTAEAEIKALKKQLSDREEELEILKKAIAVMNRLKR